MMVVPRGGDLQMCSAFPGFAGAPPRVVGRPSVLPTMARMTQNLLGGPPPTELPDNIEARTALENGVAPFEVAARHPDYPGAWAELADRAFANGSVIDSYAFARTGYHRGLDQLRRAGWKGHGPVPWEHEANRGFHDVIRTAARHDRLATMLARTVDIPVVFQGFSNFGPAEVARSDTFHHLIAEAMCRRDAARAAGLMAEHIAQGRDSVLDALARTEHQLSAQSTSRG